MSRLLQLALFAGGLAGASAALAFRVEETYSVNAQFRGAVKQGFRDLGTGKALYERLDGTEFRVEVRAAVRHPKERREYRFRIRETFRLQGRQLVSSRLERSDFNEAARPHESQVRELLPFAYLVRRLEPPPRSGGDRSRSIYFRGHPYTIRYRTTERHEEAELYCGDELRGKFFMEKSRSPAPGFASLVKFRVWLPRENLMVSFILTARR